MLIAKCLSSFKNIVRVCNDPLQNVVIDVV